LAAVAYPGDGQPTVILARTVKDKGFAEVEDRNGWHGKPFPADMAERAIAGLGGFRNLVLRGPRPVPVPAMDPTAAPARVVATLSRYVVGDKVATRKAYGDALVASAPPTPGSSPWTPRLGTRPTPTSSRGPTPAGTSRCSSPNSSSWPPPPA
jgi:transketolase